MVLVLYSEFGTAVASLPCYTAVARLGSKRRVAAVLYKVEFNSINLVRHGSSTTFETGLKGSTPGHFGCFTVDLTNSPHLSSGIVKRAKRERA